jgi:hypothetical protein
MEERQASTPATDYRLDAAEYSKGIQPPFDEWHRAVPSPRAGYRHWQLELLCRLVELVRWRRGSWTSDHITNVVQLVLDVSPQCRFRLITQLFSLINARTDANEVIRSVRQGSGELPAFATFLGRQVVEDVQFIVGTKDETGVCISSTGSAALGRLSAHTPKSTFLPITLQAVVNIIIRRPTHTYIFGICRRRDEWRNVESNCGNDRIRRRPRGSRLVGGLEASGS